MQMLLLLIFLLASAPSVASATVETWDLKLGDAAIFRLAITNTPAGIAATWERPDNLQTDGESFSHIVGPVVRREAQSAQLISEDVELSFNDPHPGAAPDRFRLHRVDADHADVTYEGTGFEPFRFVRAAPKPAPLGPWDEHRTYVRTIDRPTNVEMTAIFDADQADRNTTDINWSIVGPADDKRRVRTQNLLDAGGLQSGEDFYNAAFVFQHGSAPDDFLKAHLLAMVAIARGKPGAVWIASATLDRYLQTIGRPQILGTQFKLPKDAPVTQEPYDRKLVSDAMRKALHVPSILEQEAQRRQYAEASSSSTKPSK